MADTTNTAAPAADSSKTANENWSRYVYCVGRGHREFTRQAQYCERMYLGGGRQWDATEAAALRAQGRKPREFNEILPSINAAVGHQIKNRLDISFRPRGGNADQIQADIRSKVIMQIADQSHLHWKETEVFSDGLIQQRGYFDVRMKFDQNMQGTIDIEVVDPMDVIPDPDAKTYEPTGWEDVIRTRWLSEFDLVNAYGQDKADLAMKSKPDESDFGEYDDSGAQRSKFADPAMRGTGFDAYYTDGSIRRVRVVERQRWINTMSRVLFYPRTGDSRLAENLTPEVIAKQLEAGATMTKRMQRRVKWVASTCDVVLHDEWSPYDSFSIIPYFAFFRRGQTLGLVDNAIDPQQARNKALSNFEHILGSAANSGWVTEENSITNLKDGELEQKGAMTGLHIEVKAGTRLAPTKIQPSQVPAGHDRYIEQVTNALKSVTVPDAMRGQDGVDTSGIARQTQQFAAQQQIAIPLDNLGRTRHLMGEKLHALSQQFFTEERTYRITETDFTTGKPKETPITVNQFDAATGTYSNDLTEGEYDVVISEQPMATTFEDGQFQQAMEMRKVGVMLPDTFVVQSSTLSRKSEALEAMSSQGKPADPLADAKAALLAAQTEKTKAETVNSNVTGMFSATQAANQIAAVPAIAPLADALLKSAGFQDMDAGTIVPDANGIAGGLIEKGPGQPATHPSATNGLPPDEPEPVEANTSPNFPPKPRTPDIGANAGIERADPAVGVTR